MKYTFQTDSAAEGLRIDACIRRFLPELPSRAAQEAFSHRDVKLDGKRVKPDVRVHAGQCVEVFCMEQTAPLLDVVYEDADVLLVNKRAGISVEADENVFLYAGTRMTIRGDSGIYLTGDVYVNGTLLQVSSS